MVVSLIYDEARRIWCYRWLVITVAIGIFLAAAIYIIRLPDTYQSQGQVFINKQSSLAAATEGVSIVRNTDDTSVVEKTFLNDQNLGRVLQAVEPAASRMTVGEKAAALAGLRRGFSVTTAAADGGRFIDMAFRDTDPVRARNVTRAMMNQFIADSRTRSRIELENARRFLDDQIADHENKMLESQIAMANFRRANPSVARLTQPAPAPAPAAGGGGGGNVVYRTVSEAAPVAVFQAPQDGAIAELQSRLTEMRTRYTDEYPDVVSIKRQIANLEAQRAAAAAAFAANPPPAPPPITRNVVVSGGGGGAGGGGGQRAAPILPPGVSAQWAELLRKDELLAASYKDLMARQQMTVMSQALRDQSSAYEITREASMPAGPSGPSRSLYLAMAAFVAFGAGLGAAYLRGAISGIFVSPRELEDTCQLPVIGTVSWEPAWHTGKVARRSGVLVVLGVSGIVLIAISAFLITQ